MADITTYEARFKIVVTKSPLLSGWYAKVFVDGDQQGENSNLLTGRGSEAIMAVQQALSQLASSNPIAQIILETGLLYGTRTAAPSPKELGRLGDSAAGSED